MNDLKFAFRQLLKNPGFTAVAVLTLALGIGLNAGIFTILNAVALRPLRVQGSERLVCVFQDFSRNRGRVLRNVYDDANRASYSEYREYRDSNRVFSGLVAYAPSIPATLGGERPQQIVGTLASGNYFEVLKVRPSLGRGFLDSDCTTPGESAVVVLSDEFWRSGFDADPSIIGKAITLNRTPFVVIGVAPAGFRGTEVVPTAFWAPLTMQRTFLRDKDILGDDFCGWLVLMGRMKDGISVGEVRADLGVIAARLDQIQPGRATTLKIEKATLAGAPQMRTLVFSVGGVILSAVVLVLVIACANIANLLLARAVGRRKEIAVRLAIGASRWRLVRQLLTESLLLALVGGALGSFFAFWSSTVVVRFIQSHLPLGVPPFVLDVGPDTRVLTFALLSSLLTGITFGLVPALRSSRVDLSLAMKERGAESEESPRRRGLLRSGLVATQVTACMVLLLTTGLLLRGLYRAQFIDPGFEMKNVAVASFDFTGAAYSDQQAEVFQRQFMERLSALPGVDAVAQARSAPLSNRHYGELFSIPGQEGSHPAEFNNVSPGYFQLLGIPIVEGRNFSDVENRAGAHVAIVTESTAHRFWPGQNPIGKTLRQGGLRADAYDLEVVGVARDAQVSHLARSDDPYVYLPAGPKEQSDLQFVAHSASGYATTAASIQATVRALHAELTVNIARLEDNFEYFRFPGRVLATLSAVLGVLALILALIGVYGMVSYAVSQRVREIGIRMALGADAREVMALILRQAMRPVAVGIAIGIVGCAAASNILSSVLYGISPHDPVSFFFVPGFLLAVALLASYLPARRATKIDPMEALRFE